MRLPLRTVQVLIAAAILFLPLLPGASKQAEPREEEEERFIPSMEYHRYEFDNGFELFVLEDDSVPVVNYSLYYRAGSIDDPEGKTGISHYLEHMMFLGSEHLDAGEFSDMIDEVGGTANAYTAVDHTVYHGEVPSAVLELVMALEAERMVNLKFEPEEIEREREVIRQERRSMVDADVFSSAFEKLQAEAFEGTPLEHQVIGWMEDIEDIGRKELEAFYQQHYTPDNAVMVISGDAAPGEAQELAETYFGSLETADAADERERGPEEWEFSGGTELEIQELTHVPISMMLYQTPEGSHPDQAAVDAFLDLLVNNRSSRVQSRLQREDQLIIETGGQNMKLSVPGFSLLYIVPAETGLVEAAGDAFDEEIRRMQEEGVSEEELSVIKHTVMQHAVEHQRSSASMAELTGQGAALYGNPDFYAEYVEAVYDLDAQQIMDAAEQYFSREHRAEGRVLPLY